MARFAFLGSYQTNVGLPDGSVRLTEPGEVADLDFDDPGPLWADPRTKAAKEAKAEAAKTPAAPDVAMTAQAVADAAAHDAAPELTPTPEPDSSPPVVSPTTTPATAAPEENN